MKEFKILHHFLRIYKTFLFKHIFTVYSVLV